MDGGKMVNGKSKEIVQSNLDAMKDKLEDINPDLFLIQEIDINSVERLNLNFKNTDHNLVVMNFKLK